MKKNWLFLCLFAFSMLVFACVRDEVAAPSAPLPDGISAVKAFFDSEIGSVALPDRARLAGAAGGAAATRGAGGEGLLTAVSMPDWSATTTYRDGEMEVTQVPLDQSSEITALVRMTDSLGNVTHTKKRVTTWLLVCTDADGHRRTMTATVIPGKHYRAPEDVGAEARTMYTTHDLRGTDFTGTVLYATPEGRLIQGWNYDNGQVVGTLWLRGDYQLLTGQTAVEVTEYEDHPGNGNANGHANGNHGNAYGHDKENNGRGHAYGRMRQMGTAQIELVDERAATPGYVLSFEGGWGSNPGDDGWVIYDPIVVTPPGPVIPPGGSGNDPYDPGDPYDPYDPGDGGGGGGTSSSPYEQMIQSQSNSLKSAVAPRIQNVINRLSILIQSTGMPSGTLAGYSVSISQAFSSTSTLTLVLPTGLNATQLKLILAHEIAGHLPLFDLMAQAGSASGLNGIDQVLLQDMNQRGMNEGHHQYLGRYIEALEQAMRQAFPGESESFYEYGKWGGGLFNSDAFNSLPWYEQRDVTDFLIMNGLLE